MIPTTAPRDSERFLAPAMCKFGEGDDEKIKEQSTDRERLVCAIGLDVHYELNVLAQETGAHQSRLKPFNPRMSGPACPYNYTGKFVPESVHTQHADDPVELGRKIESSQPYDPTLYKVRDPRLVSKTVVVRDYGCKIPIDLADTEKIARAVLNHYPDQYVGFLGEFVSNLFGLDMRKYLQVQRAGFQRLLDEQTQINQVSWGAYRSVQGGIDLTKGKLDAAGTEIDTKEADHTLPWTEAMDNALGQLARDGRAMTGACSAQDIYDLRPCLTQHIETLTEMIDVWCRGFGAKERHVLAMLWWCNDMGRNLCSDLQLIDDSKQPQYDRVGLHVPVNFLHEDTSGGSEPAIDDPDKDTFIRKKLKPDPSGDVPRTQTRVLPVGSWTGNATVINTFVGAANRSIYHWGWGHPGNLATLFKSNADAGTDLFAAPYLQYSIENDNKTVRIKQDKCQYEYVKSRRWSTNFHHPDKTIFTPAEKRGRTRVRDSLQIEDEQPHAMYKGIQQDSSYRAVTVPAIPGSTTYYPDTQYVVGDPVKTPVCANSKPRAPDDTPDRNVCVGDNQYKSIIDPNLISPGCEHLDPYLTNGGACFEFDGSDTVSFDPAIFGPFVIREEDKLYLQKIGDETENLGLQMDLQHLPSYLKKTGDGTIPVRRVLTAEYTGSSSSDSSSEQGESEEAREPNEAELKQAAFELFNKYNALLRDTDDPDSIDELGSLDRQIANLGFKINVNDQGPVLIAKDGRIYQGFRASEASFGSIPFPIKKAVDPLRVYELMNYADLLVFKHTLPKKTNFNFRNIFDDEKDRLKMQLLAIRTVLQYSVGAEVTAKMFTNVHVSKNTEELQESVNVIKERLKDVNEKNPQIMDVVVDYNLVPEEIREEEKDKEGLAPLELTQEFLFGENKTSVQKQKQNPTTLGKVFTDAFKDTPQQQNAFRIIIEALSKINEDDDYKGATSERTYGMANNLTNEVHGVSITGGGTDGFFPSNGVNPVTSRYYIALNAQPRSAVTHPGMPALNNQKRFVLLTHGKEGVGATDFTDAAQGGLDAEYNVNPSHPQFFACLDAAGFLWNARKYFNPADCNRPQFTEQGGCDEMHYWCRTLVETFVASREAFLRDNPTGLWEHAVKMDPGTTLPASMIGSMCERSWTEFFPLLPAKHPLRDDLRKVRALEVVWGNLTSYRPGSTLAHASGAWMPLSVAHQMRLYKEVGLYDEQYRVPRNPWLAHNGKGISRVFNQSYHSVYYTDSYQADHFQDWLKHHCRYQPPTLDATGCSYPFSQYGGTPVTADFTHHKIEKPVSGMEKRHKQLVYNRFGYTSPLRLGQQFHDTGLLQDMYSLDFEYRPFAHLSDDQRAIGKVSHMMPSNFLAYARNHAIIALASCNHGTEDPSPMRIVRNLYRLYVDTYECMAAKTGDNDGVPVVMGFLPAPVNRKEDRPVILYAGSLSCLNTKLERFCNSSANKDEKVCKIYKQVYLNDAALLFTRLVRHERRKILHRTNYNRARMKRGTNYDWSDFQSDLISLQDTYIEFLQTSLLGILIESGADMKNLPLNMMEPRELEVSLYEEDDNLVGNDFLTPRTRDLIKNTDWGGDSLTRSQLATLSLIPPNYRVLGTMRLDQSTEIIDFEHIKKQIQKDTIEKNKKVAEKYVESLVDAEFAKRLLEVEGPLDPSFDLSAIQDPIKNFKLSDFKDPLKESEGLRDKLSTTSQQASSSISQALRAESLRADKGPDSVLAMNQAEMNRALQAVRDRVERDFQKHNGVVPKVKCLALLRVPEHVKRILRPEYER